MTVISIAIQGRIVKLDQVYCDIEIPVGIEYRPDTDPLAATITFQQDGNVIEWRFGVDLLLEAVQSDQRVGEGDIRFHRRRSLLKVCLQVPEGHSDVVLPAYAVQHFATQVGAVDMAGVSECLSTKVDELIKEILGA